jgi:hypothetical protein
MDLKNDIVANRLINFVEVIEKFDNHIELNPHVETIVWAVLSDHLQRNIYNKIYHYEFT